MYILCRYNNSELLILRRINQLFVMTRLEEDVLVTVPELILIPQTLLDLMVGFWTSGIVLRCPLLLLFRYTPRIQR